MNPNISYIPYNKYSKNIGKTTRSMRMIKPNRAKLTLKNTGGRGSKTKRVDNHPIFKFQNGDIYQGDWYNNKKKGKGTMTYANGDNYDGYWRDDKMNSNGIFTYANGDLYFGEWKNDKKEGKGTMRYKNGDEYEGQWKDNKMEGSGIMRYKNGDLYEGQWKDDAKEGKGKITCVNNYVYSGYWLSNNKHGPGIMKNKNSTYEGYFEDDKMQGKGKIKWSTGDEYDGEWYNNMFNGMGKIKWSSGDEYEGQWTNGKKDGLGKFKYRNYQVDQGLFEQDKFVGYSKYSQIQDFLSENQQIRYDPNATTEIDLIEGKEYKVGEYLKEAPSNIIISYFNHKSELEYIPYSIENLNQSQDFIECKSECSANGTTTIKPPSDNPIFKKISSSNGTGFYILKPYFLESSDTIPGTKVFHLTPERKVTHYTDIDYFVRLEFIQNISEFNYKILKDISIRCKEEQIQIYKFNIVLSI